MSNNNSENSSILFDMPKDKSNVIKVIGVGGGGTNAINHMFNQGINGVDFIVCNTDSQSLEKSPVPVKIQLGVSLTEGLGAGANPEIGEKAAEENLEEIKMMLDTNTKMVFITAGMGGGTGTGAAPVIAKMAKEMGILTVGIVTIPFQFEGKTRNEQAKKGVESLRKNVDSLIVINNNKLREEYGNLGFKAGFAKADEVLATAAKGIAEVITHHYLQNIDLRDAKTVLLNSGTAIMGSATASGADRASVAITKALDSPLLDDNKIQGATNVLLLIVSGSEEITIDEIGGINEYIQSEAGNCANIIMGVGEDESLDNAISITVIATGFNTEQQDSIANTESKKVIHVLDNEEASKQIVLTDNPQNAILKDVVNEPIKKSVIKHTLFDEEPMEPVEKEPFEDFVETSELIKNLDVSCEEIDAKQLEKFEKKSVDDFEIVDVTNPEVKEIKREPIVDINTEQTPSEEEPLLIFDIGEQSSATEEVEVTSSDSEKIMEPTILSQEVEEITVNDPVEVTPPSEALKETKKIYSLGDYQEIEDHLEQARPKTVKEEIEEEMTVEVKKVETQQEDSITKTVDEPADPLNTPISKLLRDRAEIRRRQLKAFNYKFNNQHTHIDEIEKQPAYKRKGIDLKEPKNIDSTISRISVNVDDNGLDLRTNNSFLHDNVD